MLLNILFKVEVHTKGDGPEDIRGAGTELLHLEETATGQRRPPCPGNSGREHHPYELLDVFLAVEATDVLIELPIGGVAHL